MKNRLYISIFFTFIFVAVFSLYATATSATENYTAYIEDLGFSITIPAPYLVDDEITDPDQLFSGSEAEKEMDFGLNPKGYLYVVMGDLLSDKSNGLTEITVTSSMLPESENYDFATLDDYSIEYWATAVFETYSKAQYLNAYKYEIYKHPERPFVELHFSNLNDDLYVIQYIAVYNRTAVLISFYAQLDADTATCIRQARDIMSTIVFDEISHKPLTPSFEYTDKNNDVSFTVPENWSIRSETHDSMQTLVFFAIENSPINSVGYSCANLLNAPQIENQKEEYEAFFAEFKPDHEYMYSLLRDLGCEENSICQNTYAKTEYFRGTIKTESNGFETEVTCLIRYHNGYFYYFTLTGNHDYFGDFVSLIQSVNYPLSEAELQAEHDEKSREKANQKAAAETISDNAFTTHLVAEEKRWNVVKIAAIIVCAVVIVVFEVKFIKKKD